MALRFQHLFASAWRTCRAAAAGAVIMLVNAAAAQDTALSERAKARDVNNNNLIERQEAGGALKDNFDEMDCDKNGGLDGAEIRGFFTGAGCPKHRTAAKAPKSFPPLHPRAKTSDKNNNNLIEREEAGGPLKDNFIEMDCDKNGGLDANEIRGFFTGAGCPKPGATAARKPRDPKALNPRSKAADANQNGVIDRHEAGGPLLANFGTIDSDKSGTLDGAEIRNFFVNRSARASKPSGKNAPAPKRSKRRTPLVQIDSVIEQVVGQTFPVVGRLVARQSGVIAAEVGGSVNKMSVNVGDRVRKGDVIAVIDTDRLASERDRWTSIVEQRAAMVQTARALLKKRMQEERRLNDLRTSAAFSKARFEDIEQDVAAARGTLLERDAQLREARAQLKTATINLTDTSVRAPYDGVVVEKHIDVGAYLKVGDRIATLLNDREIEVEAEVPTDQIYGLKTGIEVTVTLDDGTSHPARVRAIVPQENQRTRTRAVRFSPRFNAVRKTLATDQSVTVAVPMAGRTAVTVHKDAIVRRGTNAVVYVVRDNRARAQQVIIGRGVGTRFVVRKGIKPGDMVVIRGNERLGGGGPVKIVKAPSRQDTTAQ